MSRDDGSSATSERRTNAVGFEKETFEKEIELEHWTKKDINWPRLIGMIVVHSICLLYMPYLPYMKWQTLVWFVVMFHVAAFGMGAGAHRLWTHRAYKAKTPLRIFLMLGYSAYGVVSYDIFNWVRDHRVHHRYTDTEMDSYNAKQGFFFSHIGWMITKRSPPNVRALRETNMQDIFNDPVAMFERRYHYFLMTTLSYIMPTVVPMLLWEEDFAVAYSAALFRCILLFHSAWSVNSFAHMWGWKPFNKNIMAAEIPIVSFFALGEGWHNFHHMFPWDYKASETGFVNSSAHFIDLCQRLGLAYDLKTASPELVKNVILKYGDGSHAFSGDKIQEVSEEALNDPIFLSSLPKPAFNKHQ